MRLMKLNSDDNVSADWEQFSFYFLQHSCVHINVLMVISILYPTSLKNIDISLILME